MEYEVYFRFHPIATKCFREQLHLSSKFRAFMQVLLDSVTSLPATDASVILGNERAKLWDWHDGRRKHFDLTITTRRQISSSDLSGTEGTFDAEQRRSLIALDLEKHIEHLFGL